MRATAMFVGQYPLSLNEQNRLALPARFLDLFSSGAVVTQGFDRNLIVFTSQAFQGLFQRISRINMADPLARLMLRMFLGSATELEMDASGHIFLPQNLQEFANLHKEAILVGQGEYMELWSPELWQVQTLNLQDAEVNANRFAVLDISLD
jgi:MraZ protein